MKPPKPISAMTERELDEFADRFIEPSPRRRSGPQYLCAGYKDFFRYVDGLMRLMVELVRDGHHADEVMQITRRADRNQPCPCGSGRTEKFCHATRSEQATSVAAR
jgi:SEC-C motif